MTARATFKQSDLTRAIRAVQSAGLRVVRTEIDEAGRIVLIHEGEGKPRDDADDLDLVSFKR